MRIHTFTDNDILKVIEGDRATQNWVYGELRDIMRPIVLRKFRSDDIAVEEIIQDSIIKLLANIHKVNHKAIPNYAKMVARNLCIDKLRLNNVERKRKTYLSDDDEVLSCSDLGQYGSAKLNGDDILLWDDNNVVSYHEYDPNKVWKVLFEAIEGLSPAYKAVFEMYYLDKMSHQEIGEELGICAGSSKSNLHKARNNMRTYLGTYERVICDEILT